MWKWFKKKEDKPMQEEEEFEGERALRAPQEVGERIVALLAVIGKVHDDNTQFQDWLENHSIHAYLSKDEQAFINTQEPSKEDQVKFSWRAEALTAILWAAKIVEDFPELNKEYNVFSNPKVLEIIKQPASFLTNIELRTKKEIEEREGELYEQHWRVRDAQLKRKEMPKELNPSIVYERRYGLSWLIGYGEDWDNVPTDT